MKLSNKTQARSRPADDARRASFGFCLNDACRYEALIDVSKYADDVEVPSFQRRIMCGKCGRRKRWVDARTHWKEKAGDAWQLGSVAPDHPQARQGVLCARLDMADI